MKNIITLIKQDLKQEELLVGNDVLKHKRSAKEKKVKFTFPKNRTEMNMRKENHLIL